MSDDDPAFQADYLMPMFPVDPDDPPPGSMSGNTHRPDPNALRPFNTRPEHGDAAVVHFNHYEASHPVEGAT